MNPWGASCCRSPSNWCRHYSTISPTRSRRSLPKRAASSPRRNWGRARKRSSTRRPPLAVKPLDGNQGRGISLRLHTAAEIAAAFDHAVQIASSVIVEEFFEGKDYRVLVVDGKLVAASERQPAHVVGDGQQTI